MSRTDETALIQKLQRIKKTPVDKLVLVSDNDGTLLDSGGIVSQENLKAIERFREKGGRFAVATGRSTVSFAKYVDIIKSDLPVILCNGSVIYDYNKNEFVYASALPVSVYDDIREITQKFPEIGILFVSKKKYYIPRMNQVGLDYLKIENIDRTECSIDDVPRNCMKALFCVPDNLPYRLMDKFSQYMIKKFGNTVAFTISSPHFFEMIPAGINKGAALKKLLNILDTDISNSIAAGDYDNDIELIQAAGLGIAVSNATYNLKLAADMVLPYTNNQNAIAKIIDMILGEK